MDPNRSLSSSFLLMLLLQTVGSVDMPGHGGRKLPAPRAYMAIIIAWGVLQLIADSGRERAAATVGWILLLTGAVVGPFGSKIVGLFNAVAPPVNPPTSQG